MLEGLPSLFDYVVALVTKQRQRDSLAIVLYYLLGDVVNATEFALTHYFPLTLREPYLQDSSIGSPYQKWAKFTNDDFETLNQCLRRLIPALWQWYEQTIERSSRPERVATKDAWHWFYSVNTEYACCVVNSAQPELTLAAINISGWVDPTEGRFLNVVNRPSWDRAEQLPPIVTKSVRNIADRSVVSELHHVGLGRLNELRDAYDRLARWLRANYTMQEITTPHRGTLSDCWLG